jgi:hypothetical protein
LPGFWRLSGSIRRHVPDEEEYLFAAYSVFTVCDEEYNPYWSDNATRHDPHRIAIDAAIDNSLEREDLPLAPYSWVSEPAATAVGLAV